jgi:hypothetical protein
LSVLRLISWWVVSHCFVIMRLKILYRLPLYPFGIGTSATPSPKKTTLLWRATPALWIWPCSGIPRWAEIQRHRDIYSAVSYYNTVSRDTGLCRKNAQTVALTRANMMGLVGNFNKRYPFVRILISKCAMHCFSRYFEYKTRFFSKWLF